MNIQENEEMKYLLKVRIKVRRIQCLLHQMSKHLPPLPLAEIELKQLKTVICKLKGKLEAEKRMLLAKFNQ